MTLYDQFIDNYDLELFEPSQQGVRCLKSLPDVLINLDLDSALVTVAWSDNTTGAKHVVSSTPSVKSLDFIDFIERQRISLVESVPEDERWPIYVDLVNKRKLEGYSQMHTETRLSDGNGVMIFSGVKFPHRKTTVVLKDYKIEKVV